jgi:hypothetical protein
MICNEEFTAFRQRGWSARSLSWAATSTPPRRAGLPWSASSIAGRQTARPDELHRHELVPARSTRDRRVVVAYRPGGLLVVEIEQPEAPRVLWMEHWAERDRHVAIQKVLPVGDVPLHDLGFRRTHVLRERGTRRKKPVEERHATSLPERAPAQRRGRAPERALESRRFRASVSSRGGCRRGGPDARPRSP